ncbi:hypothetical protein Pla163_31570 [Planctomycetes bacterium Pla163]|uniref:Uncharacterized protein n=1 Tax=Rohdeia mirabilis TaxID=2528008 RepID=A0A518D3F8_9BACT|nr:hypothetical protein Pla163_31570 [Planctomycetes bacterium Pla163]
MSSPSPRSAVASTLRVTLAFVATALAIGFGLPWPSDAAVGPKIDAIASDERGFDILLVGPSGIYRGIDPAIVDAILAERGHDLRCYNASAPGMVDWEADFVLRTAVEAAGDRLAWVVVEPNPWDPDTKNANTASYRYLFWHTLGQSAAVVRAALDLDRPRDERVEIAATHARLAARRLSGYGTGKEFLRRALGLDSLPPEKVASARAGGYLALEDDTDPKIVKRGATFRGDKVTEYEQQVTRLLRSWRTGATPRDGILDDYDLASHRRQVDWLEARGLTVVHAVPPYSGRDLRWEALLELGEIRHLLSFNDPTRFPGLYVTQKRFDRQHLTRAGAADFSRVFANELADLIEASERD